MTLGCGHAAISDFSFYFLSGGNNMFKKALAVSIAAVAVLVTALPASAATFTSTDGILSIELPNDNWTQIQDPAKWIALSDGANLITIEHFSNGEKLPDIPVADSHYINTLSAAFSTPNEVFVANGFVTDSLVMDQVNKALLSIEILKYGTKQAVADNSAVSASEFSIAPADMTKYVKVNAGTLSVRNGFSVDSTLIGSLANGATVKITGVVQRNGSDYGWYQIAYNNGSGFVSADYLSDAPTAGAAAQPASTGSSAGSTGSSASSAPASASQPAQSAESSSAGSSDTLLIYSEGSGRPVYITGSDGHFYDGFGNEYYRNADGSFSDGSGTYSTTMTENAPQTEILGLVSEGSGRPVSIMANEDDSFTDEAGNEYFPQEDGTFVDEDGNSYDVNDSNE